MQRKTILASGSHPKRVVLIQARPQNPLSRRSVQASVEGCGRKGSVWPEAVAKTHFGRIPERPRPPKQLLQPSIHQRVHIEKRQFFRRPGHRLQGIPARAVEGCQSNEGTLSAIMEKCKIPAFSPHTKTAEHDSPPVCVSSHAPTHNPQFVNSTGASGTVHLLLRCACRAGLWIERLGGASHAWGLQQSANRWRGVDRRGRVQGAPEVGDVAKMC